MAKKPNSGSDFGSFGLNWGLKVYFVAFTSTKYKTLLLAIIVCMQFQEKLMI